MSAAEPAARSALARSSHWQDADIMRVLLTGASGFIGAYVARALSDRGAEVRGLCRSEPPPFARVSRWLQGDVTDARTVAGAVRGCDAVIHCAGLYSYSHRQAAAMAAVNVTGTRHVCEAALGAGVRRVLVTSTSATCGPVPGRRATEHDEPPAWELAVPYKRTKFEAERLALSYAERGLHVVTVNPTTVVGARDLGPTPSGKVVRDLVEGRIRAFVRGSGLNIVGVRDVAAGHLLALKRGRRGERYILGGEDLAMERAWAIAAAAVGRRPPRLGVPWGVPYALALGAERLSAPLGREPSLLVLDEVKLARYPLLFSSDKARRELGYVPEPAAQALTEAARWFAGMQPATPPSRASLRTRLAAFGRASIRSGGGAA
jgi:dihydroflavonol-4-reductase